MADRGATDQVRLFERPQLLEHPGPGCPETRGELIGRGRTVQAQAQEEVTAQGRRPVDGAATQARRGGFNRMTQRRNAMRDDATADEKHCRGADDRQ